MGAEIYKTRRETWKARISISLPSEPCVVPKQKLLYTAEHELRFWLWMEIADLLGLEGIR